MTAERLFRAVDVARLARIDVRTVRRWDRAGIAKASERTGNGGHRRYTLADLQRVVVVAALYRSGRVRNKDLAGVAAELLSSFTGARLAF